MEKEILKDIYRQLDNLKQTALKLRNSTNDSGYIAIYMTISEGVELIKENIAFLNEDANKQQN